MESGCLGSVRHPPTLLCQAPAAQPTPRGNLGQGKAPPGLPGDPLTQVTVTANIPGLSPLSLVMSEPEPRCHVNSDPCHR